MDPTVQTLLQRLATDAAFANAFFADRDRHLDQLPLEEGTREALRHLDRDALMWREVAVELEPQVEREHLAEHRGPWITAALGLWLCAAYVFFWVVVRTPQ